MQANCKYAGPKLAAARRDLTLPVWWNPDCDIILMRLVAVRGYGQWKRISTEKALANAPGDFDMPARQPGFEWVTSLTPALVQKRVSTLVSAVSRHMIKLAAEPDDAVPNTFKMPPGTPTRSTFLALKQAGKKGTKRPTALGSGPNKAARSSLFKSAKSGNGPAATASGACSSHRSFSTTSHSPEPCQKSARVLASAQRASALLRGFSRRGSSV